MTKLIKRLIAGTLALACFATAGVSAIVTNGFGLLAAENAEQAVAPQEQQAPIENGGMVASDVVETFGMSLNVQRLSSAYTGSDANAGIATVAEDAYQLTATVLPADAADKTVTYTAAWSNASSTWATGKNVSDYVTITQATAGALTATLTCDQAFGEPIIVTVTSNDNADAKATATLHYVQKVESFNLYQDDGYIDEGFYKTEYSNVSDANQTSLSMYVDFENEYSSLLEVYVNPTTTYTREWNWMAMTANLKMSEAFSEMLYNLENELGLQFFANEAFELDADGWHLTLQMENLISYQWLENIQPTNEDRNAIINALAEFEGVAYIVEVSAHDDGNYEYTATFNISLDTSKLTTQKRVESVTLDKVELEF